MQKIKRTNMSQKIAKEIIEKIENKEYPLYSRLPSEKEFTQMFGVGRSTVRESLSVLKSLGIISSRQGGGHFVEEGNLSDLVKNIEVQEEDYNQIKHLFEVRMTLEPKATYFAAERRTRKDLELLRKVLDQFEIALLSKNQIGQKEDYTFHKTVVQASYNPILIQIMKNLAEVQQKVLEITLKQNMGLVQKRKKLFEEHEAIYRAIEDKQPKLAEVLSIIHLESVRKKLFL